MSKRRALMMALRRVVRAPGEAINDARFVRRREIERDTVKRTMSEGYDLGDIKINGQPKRGATPSRRTNTSPISVVDNEFDAPAPPLRRYEGSWMVTSPSGEVRELFTEANVRKALAKGWKAESAGTYLGRINKGIREGSN